MSKVIALLAALALFAAIPAVAAAQTEPDGGGDTVSSGNTQDADIEQEAEAGGNGENGHHGRGGGNAGNQAAICQQNAGGDVQTVELAETGFDVWVLALLGGLALAGGAGLLAAQRLGRRV